MRTAAAIAIVVMTALATLTAPSASATATGPPVYLPEPAGPYRPGTTLLHLVDRKRIDDLAPTPVARELMAQVWYPAVPLPHRPKAAYAPPLEAAAIEAGYALPPNSFVGAVTHSLLDVPALPGRFPVVVFSHGLCASRTDSTALNERLASRGFVVVALGTTYESSPGVQFPDGRLVTTSDPLFCRAGNDPWSPEGDAILNRLQRVRVADVRFTLDELTRLRKGINPDVDGKRIPHGLPGALDLSRVGVFGHSMGGSTSAQVLADDPRVSVGVNLDGFLIGRVRTTGLGKPFLLFGSDYHSPETDPSWADFLPELSGWHRWLRLREAGHYRFIDLGGTADTWGLRDMMDPENWRLVFGDIGERRSQQIVLDYTSAFFEHFLKGKRTPILDGSSPAYPEVEFAAQR